MISEEALSETKKEIAFVVTEVARRAAGVMTCFQRTDLQTSGRTGGSGTLRLRLYTRSNFFRDVTSLYCPIL